MIKLPETLSRSTQQDKLDDKVNEVLQDFWICCVSREASLMARREVLTGKAKFGITGDGKEVPQVAMARAFRKGDFRSGYYRDQTLMFALGLLTVKQYFAQLYADTENDPHSGGRQMNAHFSTPFIDDKGEWLDHRTTYNISADISSTGGQMARALGLALSSKLYRQNDKLDGAQFSDEGNEVCFATIGDSSTSEGIFWEVMNAAAVHQVPLAMSVWDDGYGISVPKEIQTVKSSISRALEGFLIDGDSNGIHIYVESAWNYPKLVEMYARGVGKVRENHEPALFHVQDVTQPQGHSTSGSHERYKSEERLKWEEEYDCIRKMAEWMIEVGLSTQEEIDEIRSQAKDYVKNEKAQAWKDYYGPIKGQIAELKSLLSSAPEVYKSFLVELKELYNPSSAEVLAVARKAQLMNPDREHAALNEWIEGRYTEARKRYNSKLHSESEDSALQVPIIPKSYSENSEEKNGYEILNRFFDIALDRHPELIAFGEDVGQIGDVNQGFAGMQEKYGVLRVFDSGIREWSIVGQAIGTAMRGLRPIAEMQYLDYLIYGLPALSDDLSTLHFRSNGTQKAPAIIRTRGHRLEGIWHAGSPIGMLINAVRGTYVLTPRNMVQAAGFYNTMLKSSDPAIIIECLNGYRLKEKMPDNLGEYTVPLGVPETLREGTDITLVTYGSCVRLAEKACDRLQRLGISAELIDVQSLLPFDLEHRISASIKKTNRLLIIDEDVPGGASAYILQKLVEEQNAYFYLDSQPMTLTAKAHRTPYADNGDYFTKPNTEDIVQKVYAIMHEVNPQRFSRSY